MTPLITPDQLARVFVMVGYARDDIKATLLDTYPEDDTEATIVRAEAWHATFEANS